MPPPFLTHRILSIVVAMACAAPASSDSWLTAMVEHEGAPLALRVRQHAGTPNHRARLTRLVAVTHVLAQVRPNGLPEAAYNDSLIDLDGDIVAALEADGDGLVVLIETGGGQRTYYSYATPAAAATRSLAAVQAAHSGHELQLRHVNDSTWALFDDYRKRFRW